MYAPFRLLDIGQGPKLLKQLSAVLDDVAAKEGAFLNRPLLLSTEALEYLGSKVQEHDRHSQAYSGDMGDMSVVNGDHFEGQAGREEREVRLWLKHLQSHFKAVNYVQVVERDRRSSHGVKSRADHTRKGGNRRFI
jgi:hypothetical protein